MGNLSFHNVETVMRSPSLFQYSVHWMSIQDDAISQRVASVVLSISAISFPDIFNKSGFLTGTCFGRNKDGNRYFESVCYKGWSEANIWDSTFKVQFLFFMSVNSLPLYKSFIAEFHVLFHMY